MADINSSSAVLPAPIQSVPSETITTPTQAVEHAPTSLSSYFTQSQFAIALIIQKSKPKGLSTSEYCLQLQKNIQQHRPHPKVKDRYIDTHEFWKDQYMRIYEEKKALEDKVHCLEEMQRTEEIGALSDTEGLADANKKRQHQEPLEGLGFVDMNPETPGDASMLRLGRYILQIGQRCGHLRKVMREPNLPEYLDSLVSSSQQVLKLLEAALEDCTIPFWSLQCTGDVQTVRLLQQLMHQIVLGFRSCFDALNELCLTILGRSKRVEIVYRLAMFFNKALDHLRTTCTLQAENEIQDRRRTRSKRAKIDHEYAINMYLCQALVSITQMEWKVGKPGHSDILEGVLFSILDYTGRLVSNAVFNEHVAKSDKVGHITMDGLAPLDEAAKIEAQYIIPVLRAALGGPGARNELVARILSDRSINLKEPSQNSALVAVSDGIDLLTKTRKRLQATLIKSALGGEELEGLSMPAPPDEGVDYPREPGSCAEKFGPEWLLESVWTVLGWELAI